MSSGVRHAAASRLDAYSRAARAQDIRHYLRMRQLRRELLPAPLAADPAWDILLDLFVAETEGKPVTVTDACLAAGVPVSTGQRWVARLVQSGLIERHEDEDDQRLVLIRLLPPGRAALTRWVARAFR